MTHDPLWDYYDRAASEALNEHRYNKASRIVKDALFKAKQLNQLEPNLVHYADELARVYRDSGDYMSAASLYRMLVDLQSATLGPSHPDVANSSKELQLALVGSGFLSPGNA